MPLIDNNVAEFISSLDSGVLEQQLGHFITQIAASSLEHNRKGKLILALDFSKLNDEQITFSHKISTKKPTRRGSNSEEISGSTVMHFHSNGTVSIAPEQKSGDIFNNENISPLRNEK